MFERLRQRKTRPLCPLCRDALETPVYECTDCQTSYHQECVVEMRGCSTLGCARQGEALPQEESPSLRSSGMFRVRRARRRAGEVRGRLEQERRDLARVRQGRLLQEEQDLEEGLTRVKRGDELSWSGVVLFIAAIILTPYLVASGWALRLGPARLFAYLLLVVGFLGWWLFRKGRRGR